MDQLIREGSADIKISMENLLRGGRLYREIDEQIIFDQLDADENAIWSLFLASGYLKVENYEFKEETGEDLYELALTNREVQIMFQKDDPEMVYLFRDSLQRVYQGTAAG